jgi:hypothetical protein
MLNTTGGQEMKPKGANQKTNCSFCDKETTKGVIKRHESHCYLNPKNTKECPVCSSPIKNYKTSKTCSYACSNTLFRSGTNNPNWKESRYQTTCFAHHERKCVVCGEDKIVAVHHMNEDHNDNRPENLVPLCPTHHQYFHSQYRSEVLPVIEEYLQHFTGV